LAHVIRVCEHRLMNETHQIIRSHRSIRAFVDEPLADETVEAIVACATAAATSSNVQATTVIRVRSAETRATIAEVAGGQTQIMTAGAFLVWCADMRRASVASELAGIEAASGMTEHFIIATVDVALAGQNAVIAAESLGLGICYIGAVRNDPQTVSDLLELPDNVYPVFGMCIGVPDQDPEVKPRLSQHVVLREEIYGEDDVAGIEEYDEAMAAYYASRSGGSRQATWSSEMAGLLGREGRPHMRQFLADRGFTMR
jgi:nitroreductase